MSENGQAVEEKITQIPAEKIAEEKIVEEKIIEEKIIEEIPIEPVKKKRGRPKGSKKKIHLAFKPDSGDSAPPAMAEIVSPQIDYDAVASGLVTTIDIMLNMISFMSKGKIEYEKLSQQEKKICADALGQEKPVLDFMSKTSGINHLFVIATFAGIFAPKIKIKKPEKSQQQKVNKVIDLKEEPLVKEKPASILNISTVKEGEADFENLPLGNLAGK